ncbi:MAG TPA: N,N-dimethylformamidase beta subunit family domain-containing protein [Vicinamibacterales bacterium]
MLTRLRSPYPFALLAIVAAAVATSKAPRAQSCGSNAIVCENQLTGNPASEWDITGAGDASIQGYATDISVNKGTTVHFKVTTTAASFSVNIYRIGYYGGMGARKVATLPTATGKNQAACLLNNTTFLVDCGNWTESASWLVPSTAVSGVYIAKLTRTDTGGSSHIIFIVRDDASTSDLLFQTSDTTWQAYNQYGGYSLYLGSPQAAYKVSYNRPFATRGQASGYGTANYFFYGEYPLVRWLEANGYDVTYSTGIDADRSGALIKNHKVLVTAGHDEYWSGGERANVEAARDAGVHLAFFSGNEIFWKTRWESSADGAATPYRTLVTYKESHANAVIDPADPPTWTGAWFDPRFSPPADGGRPQNALSGQLFMVNRGTTAITVPSAFASLRFWRNTDVATLGPGQVRSLATSSLGYEWDIDADNGVRPAGLFQLSSTTVSVPEFFVDFGNTTAPATATHALTMYKAASGALVFGAGTVQWTWGLDPNHDTTPDTGSATPDRNMQQATLNLLADMGAQPQTRQANLSPATATSDVFPPSSTISSPPNGGSVPAGLAVTISGTATDSAGAVAGVEVSTDGGATWHPATGRGNWSYSWRPGVLGATTIQSRSVDDSGNIEAPGPGISLTVTEAGCPCSIWTDSTVPWNVNENDSNAIETGLKFRSDVNGQITGVRFYKGPGDTGTHTGHLWTSGGQLLATVTFTNESASGWQRALFAAPVSITAGTTYIASYYSPNGHYAADSFYFGRGGVDQWPLHALANGADGPNSVYAYGANGTFPSNTYQSENYWVDVILGPVDTVPPTVAITSPANGSNVTGSVTVNASASDNAAVAGVQFAVDGVNVGSEATASPYSVTWNSMGVVNGAHSLTATARDSSGNRTTSAPISVNVANVDNTPPTVSVTSPGPNATVAGSAVTVTAAASDNGFVAGVQFFVDGSAIGSELTASPWSIAWNTTAVPNGAHALTARARDGAGNLTTSAAVSVTVTNGTPVIDAVASADNASASTTIAASISTGSGNELYLAFVAADDISSGNTVTGVTGGGVTWQLVRRTNVQRGTTEIWRAFGPNAVTNATITATLAQGVDASMTVVAIMGTDTSGTSGSGAIGATASANSASGAPTASLVTTRPNSWVFGVGNDWDTATARTLGGAQTLVHQYLAPLGDTYWVQRTTAPTPTSGTTVTINDTAPTADRYNLTIVEVLAPSLPTWNISGTISAAADGNGTTVILSGAGSGTATADVNGNFTFTGVFDGTYTLTPSKSGYTFSPASQTVTVSGGNVAGIAFTAVKNPTWSISGSISPATAGSGATVALTGGATTSTTADANGNFTFTGLSNGQYTVTPSKSGYTFSPSSAATTVQGANVTGISFTASAIPPPPPSPLAIDVNVSTDKSTNAKTIVSPTFSTTASGELLLALIGADDNSAGNTVSGITGGGLTWTLVRRTNTQRGTSEVWRAFATATLTNVSVTATLAQGAAASLTVVSYTGADASGTGGSGAIGATASGNANPGAPTASLTTTRANSWVIGVGNDWDAAKARTVGSGQTLVHQYLATIGDTFWVQRTTSPTATNGTTVTINDTAPSTDRYNLTIVEVLPTTGPPPPTWTMSGSISPAATASGATVTLGGALIQTTVDASGNFTFTGLSDGTYTVTPSKTGVTFSPPNQSVTIAGGNVSGVTFTAQATAGLSIDANVSVGSSAGIATITSPSFSTTSPNELVLAFVAAADTTLGNSVTTMTGGGLTWQLVKRTNAQHGTAEIWRAFATSTLSNVTVSASLAQSATWQITIVSFTGADATGTNGSGAIGATGSGNGASGGPTASLTTTRANSWVFGVGNDWDSSTGRTVGSGQTLVSQYFSTVNDTFWVQRQTNTTPLNGTLVTINDTAPTTDRWNLSICEILVAQ